ncbi:bacterial Ig-like domain-containing protein [Ruminococcus sp.]|uniref:bacterial Ig-like domain-containing protein n=1 Tax=Ruminococcus sp. TaxID=41978 RepID=UPI0025EA798B|nr:bacterial Ig-like domain-containing protein [Ruminococcus sp.]
MKKRRVIAAMTAVLCCISAFSVSSMALTSAAETESDYSLQTILEEPIYGIGISEEPKKTFYILGEELDLTGLRLNGSYRMGELISTIMNEDYQDLLNSNVPIKIDTSEFDNSKAGTYHIYALYGNAKDSFTVTVFNDSEELLKASYGDNTKLMGDVNGDGTFGIADVIMLQKWLLGVSNTRFVNWKAADFCEDDKLDIFDLCLMKRALISNETTQNTPPTTQQIGLNRTNEVIELLNDYELNDYDEIYRDSLSKMFERFNEDGYIYTFSGIDVDGNAITLRDDHPNAAIWLMPHADYEDTGIMYHVAYKGKYYQVYYYFNDPTYTTSDLWGYMEQRLNIKSIKVIDEKFGIVDKSTNDRSDVSAYFALDDTHYCKVKTYEPEDALMDFLQVLKYEKLDIADNTSTAPIIPMTAQPIGYKDMGAMIEAIKNSDVSAYPDIDREDYRKMFDRFQNDGFIYQATDNDLIKTNTERGTTLFPYAKYEDIGIGYYVTFKGNNFHIMFYSADADVLAETDGIAAYLKKRMGRSSDKEITVSDKAVSLLLHENGQCYANAFVDENHYFDVIGAVSEEELTEFLNAFAYEKNVF